MTDHIELRKVWEMSAMLRRNFEIVLAASNVSRIAGSCLSASILLQQHLDKFLGCESVVRGGDGLHDGGAKDTAGVWHGHYWVEGVTPDVFPFLADITADQFGWAPVVVLPLVDARARYIPGDDDLCARAVDVEIDRINQAVYVVDSEFLSQ
ncbi:hypothetical protein [Burkholderia gladioli]|nr:hypothetical protein [Burkholderia gladioli]